jgi:hypothetical protein
MRGAHGRGDRKPALDRRREVAEAALPMPPAGARKAPPARAPQPRTRLRLQEALSLLLRSAALLALLGLAPGVARSQEPERDEPEILAEALFLHDTLPPGGIDLNLTLTIEESDPDPVTDGTEIVLLHRVQLAMALGQRAGFTVDVGTPTNGSASRDDAGASLKFLLRAPGAGRTGLAASLDLFGLASSRADSEAGLGLGAMRPVGRLAFRAGAGVATGISSWSPRLHAGLSAAIVLGARWRAGAELVTDVGAETVVSAGPTLRAALSERTVLMAGALFQVSPDPATPAFTIQLTRSM